jgi:hypothetical protein
MDIELFRKLDLRRDAFALAEFSPLDPLFQVLFDSLIDGRFVGFHVRSFCTQMLLSISIACGMQVSFYMWAAQLVKLLSSETLFGCMLPYRSCKGSGR